MLEQDTDLGRAEVISLGRLLVGNSNHLNAFGAWSSRATLWVRQDFAEPVLSIIDITWQCDGIHVLIDGGICQGLPCLGPIQCPCVPALCNGGRPSAQVDIPSCQEAKCHSPSPEQDSKSRLSMAGV